MKATLKTKRNKSAPLAPYGHPGADTQIKVVGEIVRHAKLNHPHSLIAGKGQLFIACFQGTCSDNWFCISGKGSDQEQQNKGKSAFPHHGDFGEAVYMNDRSQ